MGIASPDNAASTIDASDLPDDAEIGLVGPDYWKYAQVKDWILMCPDLQHVDVRVYGIFRSLAMSWRNDRRLTKDQIRWLCVGVGGKPMSVRTFDDVLRRLGERELVVIDRGNVHVRAQQNAATGRFESAEHLLFRINETPAEGASYAGRHNVVEALAAYPGTGWDTNAAGQSSSSDRPQKSAHGSTGKNSPDRERKTAPGSVRCDQAKQDVSAAPTGRGAARKTAAAPRKTAGGPRKFSASRPESSGNGGHQTSFPDVSNKPTNQEPSAPSASDGAGSGWLDGDPQEQQMTPGRELLASVRAGDGSALSSAAVREYAPAVDALLQSASATAVRDRLVGGGIRSAGGIVARLRSLREEQATLPPAGGPAPARPPWCGVTALDGAGYECNEQTRMRCDLETGRGYLCPQCHPRAQQTADPASGVAALAGVQA